MLVISKILCYCFIVQMNHLDNAWNIYVSLPIGFLLKGINVRFGQDIGANIEKVSAKI